MGCQQKFPSTPFLPPSFLSSSFLPSKDVFEYVQNSGALLDAVTGMPPTPLTAFLRTPLKEATVPLGVFILTES